MTIAAPSTLCRTCMRPITHETRTEPDHLPREGWYDDCRIDALICFKAADYRHVPLAGRERAYYDAGARAGAQFVLREAAEDIAAWDTRSGDIEQARVEVFLLDRADRLHG